MRHRFLVFGFGRMIFTICMLPLAAFYLYTASWIISDYRFDVITGVPFRWPYYMLSFSLVVSIAAIALMMSAILVWLWPVRAIKLGILAILILACVEIAETVLIFWNAGDIGIGEYGKHLSGPALVAVAWGVMKFLKTMGTSEDTHNSAA
jgi:hypothetical protein